MFLVFFLVFILFLKKRGTLRVSLKHIVKIKKKQTLGAAKETEKSSLDMDLIVIFRKFY